MNKLKLNNSKVNLRIYNHSYMRVLWLCCSIFWRIDCQNNNKRVSRIREKLMNFGLAN